MINGHGSNLQDDYFSRHLYPNIDLYNGILYRTKGICTPTECSMAGVIINMA
jgi:citrate synthase